MSTTMVTGSLARGEHRKFTELMFAVGHTRAFSFQGNLPIFQLRFRECGQPCRNSSGDICLSAFFLAFRFEARLFWKESWGGNMTT